MKWLLIFLVALWMAAACVVEDQPINGGTGGNSGAAGMAGTGGAQDPCGGCSGDTPVCDEATQRCVECLDESNCSPTAPVCINNECVCRTDSDCTSPSFARCNLADATCTFCTDDEQCDGITGLPPTDNICDDRVCVDCTPETEATSCTDMVSCDPRTKTCTDVVVGSLGVCQECVADSECGDTSQQPSDEYRCVPMFYPEFGVRFPNDNAGFCLKTTQGGCERPFAVTLPDRATLSEPGSNNDYCGINETLATCPAVAALVDDARCPGGTEDCPTSGVCRKVGDLLDRCTYLCSGDTQCDEPPNPGSECGPGDPPMQFYCGG